MSVGSPGILRSSRQSEKSSWTSFGFTGGRIVFGETSGFSLPEFRQGLEWFLSHPECPGCRGGRGLDRCPIRICAINRRCEHRSECPDLAQCDRFKLILQEYPDHKQHLLRLQQQNHGSTLIQKQG